MHTAREVARRLADSTAHPRLAAALAAALFTGASFQQLATAGPRDYDDAAATLALHDRARYTDGCAAYPVPGWAGVFLRAAACFARLIPGDNQALLAVPGDRTHLLRVAETARLRPPQPPAARRQAPAGPVEWDWRERQEANRYEAMLAARARWLCRRRTTAVVDVLRRRSLDPDLDVDENGFWSNFCDVLTPCD